MQAPKEFDYRHPYLGQGSSKMVWQLDDFAVINAYDSQRFRGLEYLEEDQKI